jgi:hypothetical protein
MEKEPRSGQVFQKRHRRKKLNEQSQLDSNSNSNDTLQKTFPVNQTNWIPMVTESWLAIPFIW